MDLVAGRNESAGNCKSHFGPQWIWLRAAMKVQEMKRALSVLLRAAIKSFRAAMKVKAAPNFVLACYKSPVLLR